MARKPSPLEDEVTARSLLAIGQEPGVRVFRNNVGQGWVGDVVHEENGLVTLVHARRIRFGLGVGSLDFIGFRPVRGVAQYMEMDFKRIRGDRRAEQEHRVAMVQSYGGHAGFIESPDECLSFIHARKDFA